MTKDLEPLTGPDLKPWEWSWVSDLQPQTRKRSSTTIAYEITSDMQEEQVFSGAGADVFVPSPLSQIIQLKANKGNDHMTNSLHVSDLWQRSDKRRKCLSCLFRKRVHRWNQSHHVRQWTWQPNWGSKTRLRRNRLFTKESQWRFAVREWSP